MAGLLPLGQPNVVPFQRPAGPQPGMTQPGMTGNPAAMQPAQLPLPNTDYVGDRPSASEQDDGENVDVTELRKQFTDYVTIKQTEILEARTALQYYHSDQFTKDEIDKLKLRGQKPIVFNRIDRKINGLVGVVDKLRGDPKAVGRVENNESGAEIATQCVRYALDMSGWKAQEIEVLSKGTCTGVIIAELALVPGDKQDPDVSVAQVDPTTFFYDPRSMRLDFSDCRYMGVSKLMTQDEFEEMFPGKWDDAMGTIDDTGQTMFDQDRYFLWSQGRTRLRLVEHWYRSKGEWRFAFYAGTEVLLSGLSPFLDENGKTVSRYDAFAVHVDQQGVHYGFVRNMIGPQDAMNQHRTKAVHIMNTRQLILHRSALGGDNPDVETLRREGARPDGVILWDGPPEYKPQFDQPQQEFMQQSQYYQDAKQEIDGFGPNPALSPNAGGPSDISGRSLAMQQQAGLAELGTFLSQWRNWRHRINKKIWSTQQRYWTAERVLRVTNDEGAAQYLSINQVKTDPWGRPMLVNAIGQLDVDIIIDESPPHVNVMADSYDLMQSLSQNGDPVPAPVMIETSSLPASQKKKLINMYQQAQQAQQADPVKQAAQQAAIAESQAKTTKLGADAQSAQASAVHKLAQAHHEVQKTHATQTGTAIDAFQASQPPQQGQAGAPPAQGGQGGQAQAGGVQGQNPQPAQQGQSGVNPQALAGLAAALHGGGGQPQQPQAPQVPPPGGPPYGGAQLINGQFYVPDPNNPGKWAMIVDAQQNQGAPEPTGAKLAPDGHHYIFAPHARGNWRKVVQ